MLQKSTFQFLENLSKNNSKIWMDANQEAYQIAKLDFEQFVGKLIPEIAKFEPEIGLLKPKDCIFRLHRDVRFSKNKEPYKTNFGAAFSIGGKKSEGAGFYIHIQPNGCFVGGGNWAPQPDRLKAIRQEIDYCYADFTKIISNKKILQTYTSGISTADGLKNVPKGYEPTNPAATYLKLKSFVCSTPLANSILLEKDAVKDVTASFKTLHPFIVFLNRSQQ